MAEHVRNDITFDDEMFMLYAANSSSQRPNTPSVWHYTDVKGINGIINPDGKLKLRFTDSRYLNDSSEGQEICVVFENACKKALDQSVITQDFFDLIISTKPSEYELHIDRAEDKAFYQEFKTYICCFSLSANLLDMWRYYSKGSPGYSIGVNTAIIEKLAFLYKENIRFYRVIYDNDKKVDVLIDKIKEVYQIYEKHINYLPTDYDEQIRNYISNFLKEYQMAFKHECFKNEEEYRIVISVLNGSKEENKHLKFRESREGLVPFVDVELPNSNEIINEVYISPYQDEIYVDSTKSFLRSRGFACNIEHSKLPVRY